jgi:hypothetical protein
LALPLLSYKALPRQATSCFNNLFSKATSLKHVSITTFFTTTWLQGLESSIKSKHDVEASFLTILGISTRDAYGALLMLSSLVVTTLLYMLRTSIFSSKFSIVS